MFGKTTTYCELPFGDEIYEMIDGDIVTDDFGDIPEIIEFMDQEQYWPNVWYVNDHGNIDLLSINTDTGKYRIVGSWA